MDGRKESNYSFSSDDEMKTNDDNMFSESELLEALAEYQGNCARSSLNKRIMVLPEKYYSLIPETNHRLITGDLATITRPTSTKQQEKPNIQN